MNFIDTHAHIDGVEYNDDRDTVIMRAKEAGISHIFVPSIDLKSVDTVLATAREYSGFVRPMIGLHPEEVNDNYVDVLKSMKSILDDSLSAAPKIERFIAIGEVGLDYYWSREYEKEQLAAFEEQICWSAETKLPLAIHCRKAQNEMVKLMRKYDKDLSGGVFHCFTGNLHEAEELLQFDNFVLGIGGVLTFKKSNLPEVIKDIPLSRIVLETDAPYMAPTPKRGERNESAYVQYVLKKVAECYGVGEDEVARQTNENVLRVFNI